MGTRPRRVTMREIAAAVGVSVNTVSRALAGKDSVSEDTRAHIQAEAERLRYVPNSMARSLVLGAAMTVGLVITNPSNPLYSKLISTIEQHGRAHGYSLLLVATEENVENEQRAAHELLRWGVDGAIVVPVQTETAHWHRLPAAGLPIVFLNRDLPESASDFVGVDNVAAVYQATQHLLSMGAEQIYVLEEDLPISTIDQRIEGFTKAMTEAGRDVPDHAIVRVPSRRQDTSVFPWEPGESYAAARELIATVDQPSAIMVGNDLFALGVYRALGEAGLRVPQDVLVVGFGDHAFSGFITPPLTTVRLPAADIGTSAFDLLLSRLEGVDEEWPPQKVLLPPELIVRGSSTHNAPDDT